MTRTDGSVWRRVRGEDRWECVEDGAGRGKMGVYGGECVMRTDGSVWRSVLDEDR